MPWASYYWKLGKKCRRPDIGIIALEDSDGKICTHDQKDEIIVAYMKKIWAERNENIEELDVVKNTLDLHNPSFAVREILLIGMRLRYQWGIDRGWFYGLRFLHLCLLPQNSFPSTQPIQLLVERLHPIHKARHFVEPSFRE